MNTHIKKVLCAFLCICITLHCGVVYSSAADEQQSAKPYRGVFCYNTCSDNNVYMDSYIFCDDDFSTSGTEYHPSLASVSMTLCLTTDTCNLETGCAKNRQSRYVRAFLDDVGFSDIEENSDYTCTPSADTAAVVCAHKQLVCRGESCTLLVIAPRSGTHGAEWSSNFILGKSGSAAGFERAAEKNLDFAADYVARMGIEGDLKIWVAGYSRGGAVANLIAAKLIDNSGKYLGSSIRLDRTSLYAYTFGAPAATKAANPHGTQYAGIFNIIDCDDPVPCFAPDEWGFERYGTDRMLPADNLSDRFLNHLSVCNSRVYDAYTSGDSPTFFRPKKISYTDGTVQFADDTSSYIKAGAAEYIKGIRTYLARMIGDRSNYTAKYEKPLSTLAGFYGVLNSERKAQFLSSVKSSADLPDLFIALYAYFMKLNYPHDISLTDEQADALAVKLSVIAVLMDYDSSLGMELSEKLLSYLNLPASDILTHAAAYLRKVLIPAMQTVGSGRQQIEALTAENCLEALAHLLSHLLLGNIWQKSSAQPFKLNNEQICNAATLIGNLHNLVSDHQGEVIISQLRAADNRYRDYQTLTAAQEKGYRRVYISSDAPINGRISDGSGTTVALIADNRCVSSSDIWVGFTEADGRGFLRIPSGSDYRVELNFSGQAGVAVQVREYQPNAGTSATAYSAGSDIPADGTAVLALPAENREAEPSTSPIYKLYVNGKAVALLGDADEDGVVTIFDATAIQRTLARLRGLTAIGSIQANVDKDSGITILDATCIQRYLVCLPTAAGINQPIDVD